VKSTSICPKCDGRKVYAVSPVQQTYCDAQSSFRNFHLTGAELPTGDKTLFGGTDKKAEMAGPLDACVCAACGYTEWYLPEQALAVLERMLSTRDVRVQTAVPRKPFR
jgi:predicted nucleic-acid-binding Zn-ribbon protein